ncbi:MAG: zinc ribbon domain-containing protein [Brevefilum sp.]|nr:zinc ribbon domain-containing protein [Brevefilum sp.]
MPIYEYACLDCQAEFETIRSIKDADASIQCPQCHGDQTRRKLSLFNATSSGRSLAGVTSCSTCSGGSCSTCGSH